MKFSAIIAALAAFGYTAAVPFPETMEALATPALPSSAPHPPIPALQEKRSWNGTGVIEPRAWVNATGNDRSDGDDGTAEAIFVEHLRKREVRAQQILHEVSEVAPTEVAGDPMRLTVTYTYFVTETAPPVFVTETALPVVPDITCTVTKTRTHTNTVYAQEQPTPKAELKV